MYLLICTHCAVAKSHRLPFVLSNSTVNKPLSLIHSDVWGPFQSSNSGFTYYLPFIDDFSRFTWIYPFKYKHEVFAKFVAFKAYVENQFTTSLQVLRTDGGGEYGSNEFSAFLTKHGIVHQLSCPHTPSQNGVAERKHRHLIEITIALLHQSSLPLSYWFDALATAVFLVNRLPSTTLHHNTPFEVLFHSLPDYSLFRVFGCPCFPWLRPYTAHKLQPRSIPCVFIGYHPSYKGYRCLDMSTGRVYISRHVRFFENVFPCAPSSSLHHVPPAPTLSALRNFFWFHPKSSSEISSSAPVQSPSLSSDTALPSFLALLLHHLLYLLQLVLLLLLLLTIFLLLPLHLLYLFIP